MGFSQAINAEIGQIDFFVYLLRSRSVLWIRRERLQSVVTDIDPAAHRASWFESNPARTGHRIPVTPPAAASGTAA